MDDEIFQPTVQIQAPSTFLIYIEKLASSLKRRFITGKEGIFQGQTTDNI